VGGARAAGIVILPMGMGGGFSGGGGRRTTMTTTAATAAARPAAGDERSLVDRADVRDRTETIRAAHGRPGSGVDDSPTLRKVVTAILMSRRVRRVAAADGQQALDILADLDGPRVELIL